MLNAAIVGVGRWGRALVDSVQGRSEAIRFTAAVTRTPASAEAYCRDHGIVLGDDCQAVLDDPAIDAVVLATPHSRHAEQIVRAAQAGKHVFSEKPFTLTGESARRAVAACEAAGVALGLGHNRRFCPSTIELKRMIASGELGTLLHVEGNFSLDLASAAGRWRDSRRESPAGGMTSLGIHVVDCMIHLCGRIAEVDARSVRRALRFDIDDTTAALLGFENGMTGCLATQAATARLWHVRVLGSRGWAELRGMETLARATADGGTEVIDYAPLDTVRAELEAFARAACGGAPFVITPDQMVHGVAVLEAIAAAAESGVRVKVV